MPESVGKQKKRLKLIRKDSFGNVLFLKRTLISVLGTLSYGRYGLINKLKVEGAEHLMKLPNENVFFISNHQTYFADAICLYHIFCAIKWRFKNIKLPVYLLYPRAKMYYVAAEETMKKGGLLPKVLNLAGGITIKRSWREAGKDVDRAADRSAPEKIEKALQDGWVINFPQGTTSAYAPVRKGTAHLIHQLDPIVVPVVIDGFRRAFDKKGLLLKKRRVTLKVQFKEPIRFNGEKSVNEIYDYIVKAIEQEPHKKFWEKENQPKSNNQDA
jgi:1-acyl-sn-glycerol-3-phosphate acyltransferase